MNPSSSTAEPQDRFRATKRKLDDAFIELDNSIITPELVDSQPPPKRPNTTRSLYSTLAKYGITTNPKPAETSTIPTGLAKPTPHLSAILARATTKTRNFFFRSDKQGASNLSTNAEYRPSSIVSFLSRLSTFKLSTYANKPPQVDAVAASRCGWTNDGKDRLVCGICGASWVVAGRDGMSRDAANALVEKQRIALVEAHKNGCPWKSRQCDPSIYRIQLQSPAATIRGIKANAISLNDTLKDVGVKHPLTQTQLNSLKSTILAYNIPRDSEEAVGLPVDSEPPSEAAILTALFGWTLVSPTTNLESRKAFYSRSNTPTSSQQSTPIRLLTRTATTPTPALSRGPTQLINTRDALLHCPLCQRRIGVWTFLPQQGTPAKRTTPNENADISLPATPKKVPKQRQFDLLREHRSYCPYVVRSTSIPTLPTPMIGIAYRNEIQAKRMTAQETVLEGWRAVLTLVLRYGLGQKQNSSNDDPFASGDNRETSTEDAMEIDEVKAMVAGVKSRGAGKRLVEICQKSAWMNRNDE